MEESVDSLEEYLQESTSTKVIPIFSMKSIEDEFKDYDSVPRLNKEKNPVEWRNNQNMPNLLPKARGFLAMATSQADVERIFSALAFILSPLRTNLSPENLKKIIMLKINKDLIFVKK